MSTQVPIHWTPWIVASATKHFYDLRSGLNFLVEGEERKSSTWNEWIEFRMDGPVYNECTRTAFRINLEINIGVSVVPDPLNLYRVHQVNGIVASMFTVIPVYKYGSSIDPANTGAHIGCLELNPDRREKIVTSFFGRVRPDTQLIQASVEGHYRMYLDLEE